MTQNQKIFRRILAGIALVCVFLIGSMIQINFSTQLTITLAAILFITLLTFVIGMLVGYALGAGKNFKFWKDKTKKK